MDIQQLKAMLGAQRASEGLNVEDVLAMQALAQKLADIDLNKVLEAREGRKTEIDKAIESLKATGKLKPRVAKKRGPGRPKLHWRKKRANQKRWFEQVGKPRRQARLAEQLTTPEGWYAYLVKQWKVMGLGEWMTEQEWVEDVWPKLGGKLFVIRRYDKKRGTVLDNVYIEHCESRKCLFDGKEHYLKLKGYTL